jgi:glutamate-5-semialdehyde dehydrogenase
LILDIANKAKAAAKRLSLCPTEVKNEALYYMADAIEKNSEYILTENLKDVRMAKSRKVRSSLIDRLLLNKNRIEDMAECLREIAELPDPIGKIIDTWTRPNGLVIGKMRVPLGVVAVIYESRPNVTSDIAGICLKSGNSVILRGGSDAMNSNLVIGKILRDAYIEAGIPVDAVQVVESKSRETTLELMKLRDYIDVLIPRGGAELIKIVEDNAKVPVIKYGEGNCHIYIEKDADFEQAVKIVINAKTQRPGVCNALDKLLIHEDIAENFLPLIVSRLESSGVEVRGCRKSTDILPKIKNATEVDWYKEYLDLIISIKIVKNIEEAIEHINKYGTKHSDSILTSNFEKAWRFIKEIDSAAVYWNASTRFTDGNQFGLGAEVGISTQKLHSRGPMSVDQMTSTKYFILGYGQVRK